ncbi:hypothetical protein HHI36_023173, partial [Cryptolaemus montrouzieri]
LSTDQKPNKVVVRKGFKQISAITSCCCVSRRKLGSTLLYFSPEHFKDHFIRDEPVGCKGGSNPSGCMTFVDFPKHFHGHNCDFMPSSITDRREIPLPNDDIEQHASVKQNRDPIFSETTADDTSALNNPALGQNNYDLNACTISPQVLKPLPKAPSRKSQRSARMKCKSAILTDTTHKIYLEEKKKMRRRRKYRSVYSLRIKRIKKILKVENEKENWGQ